METWYITEMTYRLAGKEGVSINDAGKTGYP